MGLRPVFCPLLGNKKARCYTCLINYVRSRLWDIFQKALISSTHFAQKCDANLLL